MANEKEIGKNIKRMREEKKLSQEALADKVGVTRKAVSAWEVGRSFPKMGYVNKMCEIFDCKVSDFTEEYSPKKSRWEGTPVTDYSIPKYDEIVEVNRTEHDLMALARLKAYYEMFFKTYEKLKPDQQEKLYDIALNMLSEGKENANGN